MYQNATSSASQDSVANVSFIYNDNETAAGPMPRDISTKLYVKSRDISPTAAISNQQSKIGNIMVQTSPDKRLESMLKSVIPENNHSPEPTNPPQENHTNSSIYKEERPSQ